MTRKTWSKDLLLIAFKSDQAGWLVTKEGVQADYEPLTISDILLLNWTTYGENPTPVLKLYKEDIKSPFRSAVGGTLLRTVFIQVQKAKFDLNQALSGIDRLMKFLELTFTFVGLLLALAIVYVIGGYLRRMIWSSSNERFWTYINPLLMIDFEPDTSLPPGKSFQKSTYSCPMPNPALDAEQIEGRETLLRAMVHARALLSPILKLAPDTSVPSCWVTENHCIALQSDYPGSVHSGVKWPWDNSFSGLLF
ncbi:ATP synthase regulation protein NCA2-domain-containing protein [Lentinula edodes]|uniref:ATP synthase regulation protein NCA2-domain-containing protein n=1 Tax=Lentinula lateritia TaxID=40482 RepID=A0A9W9AWK8_9AGAR|nr:ATP synthase regulation protein NCA2-domain-containing protein [Lentinula edodes]